MVKLQCSLCGDGIYLEESEIEQNPKTSIECPFCKLFTEEVVNVEQMTIDDYL
ncbi:hypothetical protein API480_29 [Paenibacillus phage vB_PlaP_API480]|uniref:Uncharacterized protein n=1 Tax=Paenibacillus larvae subsp. larvae TaxID=147375 RepID=A0A6C0QZA1_9BACL|nr:hypothetical protein API480_29 [Paenibacillus phage vB_PlaP_API480]QHZ54029.1 hypothetical protein ERICV_05045 [Paenibacillus larvae subsp. larvae]QWE49757.1 hypothetical protein [Paenibacillus phage SV21]